jgi:transcriptional regulator with XRE-family HTH domain
MPYAKTSERREKRLLREQMRSMGLGYRDIAAEFACRYGLRPRAAWREAYGWSLQDTADRINAFRGNTGLDPGGFAGMTAPHLSEYENWPGHGPQASGRRPTPYLLALLAAVYDCTVTELIDLADRERMPAADLLILDRYGQRSSSPAERQGAARGSLDEGTHEAREITPGRGSAAEAQPGPFSTGSPGNAVAAVNEWLAARLQAGGFSGGWVDVRDVVMAAADESAEQAASEASRRVPQASVEQVRSEVARLATRYSSLPPLEFLAETRQVRDQAYRLSKRTSRPGQLADLQVAVGAACGLMAVASFDLAIWTAAIEQAHAAFLYAESADHRGLQAWAAGFQGLIAYWNGRPREAVQAIGSGLDVAPEGTARARLHSISARAWAHLGAVDQAREALAAADRERDRIGDSGTEELHDEIGGEFGWGPARQAMCSASALLLIGDADAAAVRAAEAIRLHGSDKTGSLVDMTARVDLAQAELARGQLGAAQDALRPVWLLAPPHRRYSLVRRLEGVGIALAQPQYLNAREATALAGQITVFAAQSAPGMLPGGTRTLEPGIE